MKHLSLVLVGLLLTSSFLLGTNSQLAKSEITTSPNPVFDIYQSAGENTNVLLIGWDGVQRNHLFELMGRGLLPNLSSFVLGGTIVNVTVSDHYTDTKSGWTQILTGYRWWRTGVYNNFFWFHSIPRGYAIPERLETIYGQEQLVTGFITGKVRHMETVDGTGTAETGPYTHEAIYSNLPSQLDVVSVGDLDQDRYADVVGPITIQFIENNANNHFFAFFHFSDPDHVGHTYGENSVEYEEAIETCDYWLGQILIKLNTLNVAQKTLIYITADHGFDEGGITHYDAPHIFLATNDKNVTRNGDEVDVAPTVYYGLGLWNQSFNPALDGYPLQVSLPPAEEQRRQAILADSTLTPQPSLSITDGSEQANKIITFHASATNLAAVLLLLDNNLIADGPWTWNFTSTISATGSLMLNTTSLTDGLHNIKVLAFPAHATFNGGPGNNPQIDGGSPSINSIDFYVTNAIPEFPSFVILPFLVIATTIAVATRKSFVKNRNIFYIDVPSQSGMCGIWVKAIISF